NALIDVSTDLAPHEVKSDLLFLMELAQGITGCDAFNVVETCTQLSHLVSNIFYKMPLLKSDVFHHSGNTAIFLVYYKCTHTFLQISFSRQFPFLLYPFCL
ncbi:unnamed protein product, partial [Cuscuta campestris]